MRILPVSNSSTKLNPSFKLDFEMGGEYESDKHLNYEA